MGEQGEQGELSGLGVLISNHLHCTFAQVRSLALGSYQDIILNPPESPDNNHRQLRAYVATMP